MSTKHLAFASAAVLMALSACGGKVEVRHALSGAVTYQGKPVEMGSLRFEPDASIVGFAPTVSIAIEDGRFTVAKAEGPTEGKYHVRVMGIDKPRIKKDGPPGTPWEMPQLFAPFETAVEIPTADGTFNVVVPEKRAR